MSIKPLPTRQRIVSLLPSATEIICALGLQEQLVGVSHECDFPPGVEKLPAVTRTAIPKGLSSKEIDSTVNQLLQTEAALYHLNMDVLAALKPDLIVTQALCDVCAVSAEEVNAASCSLPGKPQVVNLEPMSLQQVFDTLSLLGEATGQQAMAQQALRGYERRITAVRKRSETLPPASRPRVAVLEWIDPLFNAGHWTPELVHMAGGIDCLGNANQPSHQIPDQSLQQADPDVLLIALCGFDLERTAQDMPLLQRLPGWQELKCVRNGQVYYTDGNAYFSRPGPRLVDSLELLAEILQHAKTNLPLHHSSQLSSQLSSHLIWRKYTLPNAG
ncbi:MAG: cobalamin-binding protein [Pseudomonadales bacterium]|nr:cobalamin-binding protein [Pseudomonadales bacterium]